MEDGQRDTYRRKDRKEGKERRVVLRVKEGAGDGRMEATRPVSKIMLAG